MNKHLIMYKGNSIWRDIKNELWGKSANPSIKESRTYESDKNKEDFLDERGDIKFMIEYGHMSMESIVAPADKVADVPADKMIDAPVDKVADVPADKVETPAPVQGTTITGK
jgi:hypothetical protein